LTKGGIYATIFGQIKGERAWFLEEESEPRNKWIFLAEKRRKIRGLTN
jgi:hypothetical protein